MAAHQHNLFDALEDAAETAAIRQPLMPLAEARAKLDAVIAHLADSTANAQDWAACSSTGLHCPELEAEAQELMQRLGKLYPYFWSLEACLERFPAPPLPQETIAALAAAGYRYHGAWLPWEGHVSHGQAEHVLAGKWTLATGIQVRSCTPAGITALLARFTKGEHDEH